MQRAFTVTSFYRFMPVDRAALPERKTQLEALAAAHALSGLIILAPEGCNGTVAGGAAGISHCKEQLDSIFGRGEWCYKDSFCDTDPFSRFKVRIRPEIVTIRRPGLEDLSRVPASPAAPDGEGVAARRISAAEWQALLESGEELTLLDTRNRYETALGKFAGAIDPGIDNFQQFAEYLDREEIPRDRKVLMYCTGGIRCEKAVVEMERRGYRNLFHLEGGILRYLEQFPAHRFEGECFVFDGRVAVDQALRPTERWSLCPHCGDPGERWVVCEFCGTDARVCDHCAQSRAHATCSHDCGYKIVHQPHRAKGRRSVE